MAAQAKDAKDAGRHQQLEEAGRSLPEGLRREHGPATP